MLSTEPITLEDILPAPYTSISRSNSHLSLTNIYQDDINIAIWQSAISSDLKSNAALLMQLLPNMKVVVTVTPQTTISALQENYAELAEYDALCQHLALLVDMFCTLFELKRVGLRLTVLNNAMCPKFHVDKVPCRLVTTLAGDATEWLPSNAVDKTKLGKGSLGLTDAESGIYQHEDDIQQLSVGDVALLKGEGWLNNENNGLVHRSPSIPVHEQRLLLTLDFID